MHPGQLFVGVDEVRSMISDQFPDLAGMNVRAVPSVGTVNMVFRVGENACAHLPLLSTGADSLKRELTWLPRIKPHLTSMQVPRPVGRGRPTLSYPLEWGIFTWIPGQVYAPERIRSEYQAATRLAGFVCELRSLGIQESAPSSGRAPLDQLDRETRNALGQVEDLVVLKDCMAAWERALVAPRWDGPGVWTHSDLLRPNLLVRGGELVAVIDFGGVGVGDPANDVIAAWSVFGPVGRHLFREVLEVDDSTWERSRGIALHQAVLITSYYRRSNPGFVRTAVRTIREILADR